LTDQEPPAMHSQTRIVVAYWTFNAIIVAAIVVIALR